MSINWFGANTLLKKEITRFLKVYHQTLLSPVVNIMLFLAVFSLSVGQHLENIEGVNFSVFVSCGLIMMAAMQNSFANSSSSLVMGKVMGSYIDYVIPPLEAFELLFAFIIGAVIRGILVSIISFITISIFIKIEIHNFYLALFYIIISCTFLACLGVLCGIISNTFDQMSAVTSYIVTPLTFLSGTFYSTNSLPEFWRDLSHYNPFFYMIDGFRYSLTGHNDASIGNGITYILLIDIAIIFCLFIILKRGYNTQN